MVLENWPTNPAVTNTSRFRASRRSSSSHATISRAADLEVAVVETLARGEAHGAQLTRSLRAVGAISANIADGQIYAVLHRLERGGTLRSFWQPVPGRSTCAKFYVLTRRCRKDRCKVACESVPVGQPVITTLVLLCCAAVASGSTGDDPILDMEVSRRTASGLDAIATPDIQDSGCEDPIRTDSQQVPHVRSVDRDLQFAITEGLTRSRTMRDLITVIIASNVIAYIGRGKCAYPAMACGAAQRSIADEVYTSQCSTAGSTRGGDNVGTCARCGHRSRAAARR